MAREVRALVAGLRKNPHDVELLRAVQNALRAHQRYTELSHLLEWWAGYAPDDATASRALLDAARYLEARPDKRKHALSLVMQALMRDPSNEQAAYRLRQLLEDVNDHVELERVLSDWALAVRREGSPATLCALSSYTLAFVRKNHLHDVEGAIAALEDTLRAFPEHLDAKRTLAEMYAERARTTLRRADRRAREDCHRAAQLYYELGLFEQGDKSVELLMRALDLVPHHSGAMEALIKRVGTKNLELLRKRLAGYVALSPDRVRTHRFRFELVRTLFRERRYREAVPHLKHLASRGYVEARRILERLAPELTLGRARALPELSVPPINDEQTKLQEVTLTREDAERPTVPPPIRARKPVRDLISANDNGTEAFEVEPQTVTEELVTLEYTGIRPEEDEDRPTEVYEEASRDSLLDLMRQPDPGERITVSSKASRSSRERIQQLLGLSTVALAVTSYLLNL